MKKIITISLCFVIAMRISAQLAIQEKSSIDTTGANEQYWNKWLGNLYQMGVMIEMDSIKISDEARESIMNENLKALVYPPEYTWTIASQLLKGMEFKKGYWYLFNLYMSDTVNKKMVIETIFSLDKLIDAEKLMMGSFYTYALLDPKLCMLKNGKPVITRPDILEKEFAKFKEIIGYIRAYRQ